MDEVKLFMVLVGCRPKGRHTEQHDVFFGIAGTMKELIPDLTLFWPEAKGNLHVDAWREVTQVDGFDIKVITRDEKVPPLTNEQLFFINLGGYKKDEFEEFHYKMLTVASSKTMAIKSAKETVFYKHTGYPSAPSHIDDKYGVDVDDLLLIRDILPLRVKEKYAINLIKSSTIVVNKMHLGYFKLDKL
jgi:hypothetical protein